MTFPVLPKEHSSATEYTFVSEDLIDWAMSESWEKEWEEAWGKIIPDATSRTSPIDPGVEKGDADEPVLSNNAQIEFVRLRDSLAGMIKEQQRQVLLFSSVNSGDGASFVCRQISRLLAESGNQRMARVVIDEPPIAIAEPEWFALRRTALQNLSEIIFAFDRQASSAASRMAKFSLFLDRLRRDFDLILIDAPAVNKHSETARLAVQCDGTILVAREQATSQSSIDAACDLLESSLAEVIGVVMNRCGKIEGQHEVSTNNNGATPFTSWQEAA